MMIYIYGLECTLTVVDFVHTTDLASLSTKAGESGPSVIAKLHSLSLVSDKGLTSFDSFLLAVSKVRGEKEVSHFTGSLKDITKIVLHGTSGENVMHTINVDEKESFTTLINQQLANDVHVGGRLPMDPTSMLLFSSCRDGLLLAKLINDSVPNTIDERVLNVRERESGWW